MPYIITTIISDDSLPARGPLSRLAVATLEEAREAAAQHIDDLDPGLIAQVKIAKAGGTIGPLPDGTVIEVERVDWDYVERAVIARVRRTWTNEQFIDAYNAAIETHDA